MAAYLIGGPIVADALAREAPGVAVCRTPEQTGCVISWNARGPLYVPSVFEVRSLQRTAAYQALQDHRPVCVNPLTWSTEELPAPVAMNKGAVFLEDAAMGVLPHLASAECHDGTLVVTELGRAPRDFPSRLLDRALGPQNYHPIEYQMYYANLRENAAVRVAAYLRRSAPASPP